MKQKNILLLTIGLLLLQLQSGLMAQEYLPFPQDSAVWYCVDSRPEYDPPPPVWYETDKFEAKGDTMINTIVYTKLYSSSALKGRSYSYEGAYRVDIETERVYFIDSYYNTESLLYDFSLVPGDTIIISGSEYEPYNLICLDTSTKIINNVPHHSYFIYSYLSNGTYCYTTWVKGIGRLRMPIETDIFCAASFEWAWDLSCFYYKDEHIYEWAENPYFEGCIGTNVGTAEYIEENTFTIVPNPVTGTSHLVCAIQGTTLYDYKIISIDGEILQSEEDIEPGNIIIKKQNFPPGVYVLRLHGHENNHYYSRKFIIK